MTGAASIPQRVFLSHSSELRAFPSDRSYIAAAQDAVIRAGHAVTDMAYFGARDCSPAQVCRDEVIAADVYVLVARHRYGSLVRDEPDLSYTELEFEAATDAGLPRFVFLLELDSAGSDELLTDLTHADRQELFRNRLRASSLTTVSVRDPQELELAIYQALRTQGEPASFRRSLLTANTASIPAPPRLAWLMAAVFVAATLIALIASTWSSRLSVGLLTGSGFCIFGIGAAVAW